MDIKIAKRDRSVNWENEEKALLREIMKPFVQIVENKDISTNTNKAKMNAWLEITEQFNTANKRIRNKKQLVNQWKVAKLTAKKEISTHRRQAVQTGGGPKPPSPSPEAVQILALIPQEFEVDYNEFDCDGINEISNEACQNLTKSKDLNDMTILKDIKMLESTSPKTPLSTEAIEVESEPVLSTRKRTHRTPKMSAKKRLLSEKSNFGAASFEDMHTFRLMESERQQKEHELRMKNMAEMHDQESESQQKVHELKMKNMAEMHDQAMINLKLQEEILHTMVEQYRKNK